MAPNLAALLRLMLVTDDALVHGADLIAVCQAAVQGGVTSVELRLKQVPPRELVARARELIAAVAVPVLLNDRLDVAIAAAAAGVHLGPEDLPVALARRVTPPGFLLGASVGDPAAALARGKGADYWGVGPWRTTSTKQDARAPLGAEGFRAVVAAAGPTPCVAIGGIRPEDCPVVRRWGGSGVAVVAGILRDSEGRPSSLAEVERAARRYTEAWLASEGSILA